MPISPQQESFPEADDVALVEQLLDGDANALLQIYDRHSALVFTVACHVLHNVQTAEDISQEVFLQLWRKPRSYDSQRGLLATWLVVITRHRAIDYIRKQRKESNLGYTNIPIEESGNCEAYDWVDLDKVRAILKQLPAEHRETFELAYFGGLTHTEIAERTGQALGTVKSRIRSVLKNVRAILANVGQNREDRERSPRLLRLGKTLFRSISMLLFNKTDGMASLQSRFKRTKVRCYGLHLLAAFFIVAGVMHFVVPDAYVRIVPPMLPVPRLLVLVSGTGEIFGGCGLLLPFTQRSAAWGLVLLLLAVFPANIYTAVSHISFPGILGHRWVQWLRLPFQIPLILWTLRYTKRSRMGR
jgi:RNA polymerase sigma-70 factor (ECF subfamily)